MTADLLPCPFCGGSAERIDFGPGSGDNEGGSCIACTKCQSSGPVEFGYKENFVSNWNRRALSHAAGQDGEQCRAASGVAEVAVDLPKIRRLVGHRPMIYMNSFDGQPPCLTLNNACGVIHDLMDEVERLRALSRGVPEDVMAKAVYEAHASAYTTLRLPAWEELGGMIGDATVEHWRAIARAAIAAQRKEG